MMNPVVAAAHGKVAATVVHLLGDPTLDWAAFAEFAQAQGNNEVAALAQSIGSFNDWCQQRLVPGGVESEYGRLDSDLPPSSEGPKPASAQAGWCEASKTVATGASTGGRMSCPGCGRDVGVTQVSRIIARHKLPARART